MKIYLNAEKEDFWDSDKRKLNRISPRQTSKILLSKSTLKFSKFYIEFDAYCIYDADLHVYVQYSRVGFNLIVVQILEIVDHPTLTDFDYIKRVVDNLGLAKGHAKLGMPIVNSNLLVFNNCTLDIKRKRTVEHNPNELIFSSLPFDYNSNTDMPVFLQFLNDFCAGHEDRIEFIRNFLYIIINGPGRSQLFFHFHGKGGTGKSTLANVCHCLVGTQSIVSTDLDRISKDPFEAINLANKKVILISESSTKIGNTSVLKSISGGDTLAGRKKHIQGSYEVIIKGVVVIFNNEKFQTTDNSGAIYRRIKPFRADSKGKTQKDLLRWCTETGWVGELVTEIPAIINWIFSLNDSNVFNFFNNLEQSVPSLKDELDENQDTFMPILPWIKEEIVPGKGLYIGMKVKQGVKELIDTKQRKTLYPVYQMWCERQGQTPMTITNFRANIVDYFTQAGFQVKFTRRECGLFITNIDLDKKVFLLDYQAGSPMWHDGEEIITDNGSPGYVQVTNSCHPSIGPNLQERYMEKLTSSPMKDLLNKVCIEKMTDEVVPELVETFSKSFMLRDKTYLDSVTKQIADGVRKVRTYGGIPYKWKRCGNSPRLIPIGYGKSINFTKRVVRDKSYRIMALEAKKLGFILVDLDITSCYLAILLGLCSAELKNIQLMVETSNIWKEIEKQFIEAGKGHLFNKPAVKVCVYASYFLGGTKAMSTGIHENFRKNTGLVPKDYKESSYYPIADEMANEVINVMRSSDIIAQLKSTSVTLKEAYLGTNITGPTGESWLVTEENWSSVYANYLITFEIALLGKSTLNVIEKYPAVEIIGHYHDGCVLMIPTANFDEIIEYHQDQIAKVGTDIGLQYTQKLEIKGIY